MEIEDWMQRGDELGCFTNRLEQARYYNAWTTSELPYVLNTLERIFTRSQRLPSLNWLNRPDIYAALDIIEDLPRKLPEEWEDADFVIRHPMGQAMSPAWLKSEDAWNEIFVGICRAFLFLKPADKFHVLQRWVESINDAIIQRGLPLGELVILAQRAKFIYASSLTSPHLRAVIPETEAMIAYSLALKERAAFVFSAWEKVLGDGDGGVKILTLQALRRCEHMLAVDQLLAGSTTRKTDNLMTFLRCKKHTPI